MRTTEIPLENQKLKTPNKKFLFNTSYLIFVGGLCNYGLHYERGKNVKKK
jgi:hypothetical protein